MVVRMLLVIQTAYLTTDHLRKHQQMSLISFDHYYIVNGPKPLQQAQRFKTSKQNTDSAIR
jgi:hypothetical protein